MSAKETEDVTAALGLLKQLNLSDTAKKALAAGLGVTQTRRRRRQSPIVAIENGTKVYIEYGDGFRRPLYVAKVTTERLVLVRNEGQVAKFAKQSKLMQGKFERREVEIVNNPPATAPSTP